MARILLDPKAQEMSWWDPVYNFGNLQNEWTKSLDLSIKYILIRTEDGLSTRPTFIGFENGIWAVTPTDIALQLNYHSIHHRAQIQSIIRQQGIEPDFVDYIGTKYTKIS